MNWRQILSNVAVTALLGGAAAAQMAPAGSAAPWSVIGAGALVAVVSNLGALFQRPPHVQP